MKKNKWLIFSGLAVIAVIAAGVVIKEKGSKTAEGSIEEVAPFPGDIEVYISTTGTVEPQNRLEVKPAISGRVEEILVKEGDLVKVGRVLAWMSSSERATLLDAARTHGAETLRYWEEAYKASPLIAPIDGEVIVKAVEPGQTVTTNDAVIVLSDRLIVKAQVDETDIGKVKLGQPATVSLDAYPEVRVKAKVDHIAYESKIVSNVTIYEVDILPEIVPEVFRSGMSAGVKIVEKSKKDVLLIPVNAVQRGKKGSYVLLKPKRGEASVKRAVELGISDDRNVEVISGLEQGDKILVKIGKYSSAPQSDSGRNPLMPFGGRKRGR